LTGGKTLSDKIRAIRCNLVRLSLPIHLLLLLQEPPMNLFRRHFVESLIDGCQLSNRCHFGRELVAKPLTSLRHQSLARRRLGRRSSPRRRCINHRIHGFCGEFRSRFRRWNGALRVRNPSQ
jgi:hypothetical protein